MSIDYDNYIVQHKACVIRAFNWIIQNISTKKLDQIFPNLPSIEDVMTQLNNHDASKYSPKEYNAYDNYFYGEKTDEVKKDFDYAWLNHIHMNPHHWQYWILKEDDSPATDTYITIKCLEIPDNYILEMICDWWSFSWKNYIISHNKNDLYEVFNWYDNHRDKIAIHYRSREKVERILNIIRDILDNNDISHSDFGHKEYLAHHGIKGQQWGVRHGPPYPLKQPQTDISDDSYSKINEIYRSMPLKDRKMIDPDISDEPQDYFSSSNYYHKNTAFNAVTNNGFIIAEKIPKDQNVDGTNGVEIGIGVISKGKGIGSGLTSNLIDWFNNQNKYDAMWWPVDENNKASIRIAEKNGFIKDPMGSNYIYGKNEALYKLGVKSPPNTKELKDYSGTAYFVSDKANLKTLEPRVPDNFFTKNGYEDSETKRVCLAPSIDKCLAGLSQNLDGKTLNVYKPVDISNHRVYKPNNIAVPDSKITDEMWVCDTVPIKKVGTIHITGNRGQDGKTFTYGDNTATLYDDWAYDSDISHSGFGIKKYVPHRI